MTVMVTMVKLMHIMHQTLFVFLKRMMGRRAGLRRAKSLAPSCIKQGLYDSRVHPDDQPLQSSGLRAEDPSASAPPKSTIQQLQPSHIESSLE